MTLAEKIQIASVVATLLTAVAALFTVLQMRSQRRSQLTPEVGLDEESFRIFEPADESPFPFFSIVTDSVAPTENLAAPTGLRIRCRNLGFGVAKNVSVTWTFDAQRFAERVADADADVGKNVLVSDHSVSPDSDDGAGGWMAVRVESDRIGSILAQPVNDERQLFFPSAYSRLLTLFFQAMRTGASRQSLDDWSVPPLHVTIECSDIEGVKHTKKLSITPELSYFGSRSSPVIPGQHWFDVGAGRLVVREL